MQIYLLILSLNFVTKGADTFVYSCEEVLFKLMNSDFKQYTKYAWVIPEYTGSLGSIDWTLLEGLYLNLGDRPLNFAEIARREDPREVNNYYAEPWFVTGYASIDSTTYCNQEFTLILTSDERDITFLSWDDPDNKGFKTNKAGIYATPNIGVVLTTLVAEGEGTVTLYSGAGIGEEEQRFELHSWPCESMPDWIWIFENVVTLDTDGECSLLQAIGMELESTWQVNRQAKASVLFSGRSDNLQNRIGMENIAAKIKIGSSATASHVVANMQLNFDSTNQGSLQLLESQSGEVSDFRNGSHSTELYTNYIEVVRWLPTAIQPSEISHNDDNVYVDISISPYNDDHDCPDGYSLVSTEDEQYWCYLPVYDQARIGFTFSEALDGCETRQSSLPILTTTEINSKLAVSIYASDYLLQDAWIGLICDTSKTWIWQNGESVVYTAFNEPTSGLSCDDTMHYAIDSFAKWSLYASDRRFPSYICATRATPNSNYKPPKPELNPSDVLAPWAILLIATCGVIIVIVIAVILMLTLKRSRALKARAREEQLKKDRAFRTLHHRDVPVDADWEIDRLFVGIDISRKLGEGAFGSVFLGHVLAKNIPCGIGRSLVELSALTINAGAVAVKMLHDNADSEAECQFIAEIELMKSIGYHERIVNMLACVTITSPILLISEYCSNGDLLKFLRMRRAYMLENPDETKSANVITGKKQLAFAMQVAYGLEYLSSRGFIHRDVAARNILVDHQETCKIGDFGLARAMDKRNEIYQALGRKLPMKWMSPEALDNYFFSTAADVWSFGIVVFEIVTLGGTPYADWPTAEILPRLKRGERMERPDNCSDELYKIMCDCWSEQPSDRPTFVELRLQLGDMLEEVDEDYYLKLNAKAHYYVPESDSFEE